jgi:hypothetical protein
LIRYLQEELEDMTVTKPMEIKGDFWLYALDACPYNCSSQGDCINGYCFCYDGFYGLDCSNISCPGDFCYYDEHTHQQVGGWVGATGGLVRRMVVLVVMVLVPVRAQVLAQILAGAGAGAGRSASSWARGGEGSVPPTRRVGKKRMHACTHEAALEPAAYRCGGVGVLICPRVRPCVHVSR